MHGWTRSAQSTVEWLQKCVNSDCLFASRAKFSSLSSVLLIASISTTLARTARTDLVLSLPEESRAAPLLREQRSKLWDAGLALPGLVWLHTARDSLTINLLHADTADSFLLHGGSE